MKNPHSITLKKMFISIFVRSLKYIALVAGTSVLSHGQFNPPSVQEGWTYHHDLEIGTIGNTTLRMELVAPSEAPEKPLPVLIYIHGGGWNHGNKNDHAVRIAGIARRGYVAASIMYRFAPAHSYPAQIEDVQAAIRFLKANADTYHLDPNRINLWGTSSGGHLASLAGTAANNVSYETHGLWEDVDASVFAVVNFAGPNSNFLTSLGNSSASLTAFLGGRSLSIPEIATEAMPITHIDADDPPFFVAHGDADTTVPVTWSRDFVTALKEAGVKVEYHEFEGGGHNLTPTHPQAQQLAYEFLYRLNFAEFAGFPIIETDGDRMLADTGNLLGRLWILGHWAFSIQTGRYFYLREDYVDAGGAWIFSPFK